MSQFLPEEEEAKLYQSKYPFLYWIIGFSFILISARLWYLQIIEGEELAIFSTKNRVKETKIPAPRGQLLDTQQRVLVENLPGFEVTITPQYATRLKETTLYVGKILNIPADKIIQKVKSSHKTNGPFRPVKIMDHLSREELFRLMLGRYDHPGLEIGETIVRSYSLQENGAQLFGYVGEISKKQLDDLNKKRAIKDRLKKGDLIGQSGLEKSLDPVIRGIDGASFMQVDARGREAKSRTLKMLEAIERTQEAISGHSVVLTIDKDIQEAAYRAFNEQKDHIGTRIGALVALKPNGEVLSWISAPSYNPNEISTGISNEIWTKLINAPFNPLRNKVVQDPISPGSTFKAVVALAGLQEKVITTSTTQYCPGSFKFGRRLYHCHLERGHGTISLMNAIEQSCNIFFYKVGLALGIDRIAKYAQALGLGSLTQVDVVDEKPGLIPTTEWKLNKFGEVWQLGENLSNAIGQGFVLATPIQLAMAYAAIGSEGELYRPFVVKKIENLNNYSKHGPLLVRDLSAPNDSGVIIDKENFRIVKEGLRRVSNGERGTARWYKIPGVEIAGKTGTGQIKSYSATEIYSNCESKVLNQRHHGWFVGFAPAQKPLIVVAMLAQHSCHGSTGAAPVVRDVIQAFIEKYHPEMIQNIKPKVAKGGTP